MSTKESTNNAVYKPVYFIIGAFLFTWICIFAMQTTYIFGYEMPTPFVVFFDFSKSASPLLVALFLLRKHLPEKGFLRGYILGEQKGIVPYAIVALLVTAFFVPFYVFRSQTVNLTAPLFLSTFAGQLLFGGGMEEGGWRGYLFPAFAAKMPCLLASVLTSAVWTFWHLPYFFIPWGSQYKTNFFAYMFVTVMIGFLLTAIYLLTKSVLLCTLFHAFSNTVTMTMQADMGNIALMITFSAIAIGGAVICQILSVQERKRR